MLICEGFSFGALFLGPLWLAAHRVWWAACATLLLTLLIPVLVGPPASTVLLLGMALFVGFSGWDLARWSASRRGYLETNVVSARNDDEATRRLFAARPDLVARSMIAETAP